ncbi:phage antiterminator Q protein [Escherichia coli]|uniref:Phage antiterminator Q protein n=1 Tax=Escherichia coli TaxID=562 RepID=A0A447Y0C6_ECOLX|nr:phage antiterminator Q protein [Escherichia coli]
MSIRELNLTKEQHEWLNAGLNCGAHGFIQVVWKSA